MAKLKSKLGPSYYHNEHVMQWHRMNLKQRHAEFLANNK